MKCGLPGEGHLPLYGAIQREAYLAYDPKEPQAWTRTDLTTYLDNDTITWRSWV